LRLRAAQVCSNAFCEDHLPPAAEMIFECPRFQFLGQHHPRQVPAALPNPYLKTPAR
jgi:hypothetical protein